MKITLTARQFQALVAPVLPMASTDIGLPVLNAVQVQAEGKWLTATATDRFRLGLKRIAKVATDDDETTEWSEFAALIPVRAVKSILSTFKPTRGADPAMMLTVEDRDRLVVEASGAFDIFAAGRFVHHLETGEFPGVRQIFRDALATPDDERIGQAHINPAFLADFSKVGSTGTLRILTGGAVNKPLVITDDSGFLGALMPRRATSEAETWEDLLGEAPKSLGGAA